MPLPSTIRWLPITAPTIGCRSAVIPSVQQQVDANPGSFGYNEATHQFQLPPPTGRPELTFYASRSISDTGVQFGTPKSSSVPLRAGIRPIWWQLGHQTAGENVTLNEDLGFKLSLPLPRPGQAGLHAHLGRGLQELSAESANADLFYELVSTTNNGSAVKFGNLLATLQQPSGSRRWTIFP